MFRNLRMAEFQPAQTTLILGANGSGKTSLFLVLSRIVDLVVQGPGLD